MQGAAVSLQSPANWEGSTHPVSSHRFRVRSVQNTGISAASRTCISDILLSNVVQYVGARPGTTCPLRCPPSGAPTQSQHAAPRSVASR